MTYEEYKNKKEPKKNDFLKKVLIKLFTIVIFTMIVIITSHHSPKFKSFLVDKVLNSTIDFSFVNKITNNITNVFKINDNVKTVMKDETEQTEKYKDGVKYIVNDGVDNPIFPERYETIEQVKMARENWKNNLHKSQNHYFRAGVTIKY